MRHRAEYGADAQYILMNDIQMNSEQIWSVPDPLPELSQVRK